MDGPSLNCSQERLFPCMCRQKYELLSINHSSFLICGNVHWKNESECFRGCTSLGSMCRNGLPQCLLVSWAFSRKALQKFSTAHAVENLPVPAPSHVSFDLLEARGPYVHASRLAQTLLSPILTTVGLSE